MSTPMLRPATAGLVLAVSVLAVTACSSGGSSQSGSTVTGSSAPGASPSGDSSTVGADADAILTTTFAGRESLGGGYGALEPDLGNTLATTPRKVLSVTFAFVCTGTATVRLSVGVDVDDSSEKSTYRCDGSVNQRSVDLADPGPVTFRATVSGGAKDGAYAFGYYAEKTRT